MSTEPGWIELSEVVALNKGAVTITREQHLLINPGTLESAVMSPRNLFQYENEDDIGVLACRLIVALSAPMLSSSEISAPPGFQA